MSSSTEQKTGGGGENHGHASKRFIKFGHEGWALKKQKGGGQKNPDNSAEGPEKGSRVRGGERTDWAYMLSACVPTTGQGQRRLEGQSKLRVPRTTAKTESLSF